jgi:predicted Zn-dependent protease
MHLKVFPLMAGSGGASQVKFIVTIRTVTPMDTAEVRRFVAHEMGHVLGLAQHSPLSTDLMHELAGVAAIPTRRDRATLQALYHTAPEITP